MAYGDFPRRTASSKVLCYKAFSIAKSSKNDGYLNGLGSMVWKISDNKSFSLGDKSAFARARPQTKQNMSRLRLNFTIDQ